MISLAAITTCPPTSRMVRSLRVRVTYRMLLVFTAWMASVSIMSSFSISYLVDIFISSLYLVDACNISRQSSLPTSRSCLVELPDFPINRSLRVHIHREFFFFFVFYYSNSIHCVIVFFSFWLTRLYPRLHRQPRPLVPKHPVQVVQALAAGAVLPRQAQAHNLQLWAR